jgi:mono/diheme cytochrome c family protein
MFGRLLIYARALRLALVVAVAARVLFAAEAASADTAEAKKVFTTRCMACHTFGKGVKVGPDLKGVNDRRQRDWLLKFVRTSSQVIASGDPTATALFEQFKQQRMPDWTDLSEDQVGAIMDYLKVNGPDQQEPDARSADSATLAEIDAGRQRARMFRRRQMARDLGEVGIAEITCPVAVGAAHRFD